jgi:hypothetical protein
MTRVDDAAGARLATSRARRDVRGEDVDASASSGAPGVSTLSAYHHLRVDTRGQRVDRGENAADMGRLIRP